MSETEVAAMESGEELAYMIENLPNAMYHLRAVGCAEIDAFTLALVNWPFNAYGAPEGPLSPSHRQLFLALHLAACKLLGEYPHAPDLRPADLRSAGELAALMVAYRWAGRANLSHADAFQAYADAR
jgi:hypothetical protein